MTDLQRKNVKIFAVNSGAQGTSEFGSLKSTGSFAFSQDINDLQTSEYETGWRGAVVNGKTPTIPDFNTISRVISEQVAYLYQKGMAEWSSEQTYFIGNKCMVINNGVPQEYYSLTDNNIGNNPLNDTTNWKNINDLIFENISNSYVDLDGSNATFTNLSQTAQDNITSFIGLKKIIEFDIEDGDSEIVVNNITNADLHKFLFGNLEVNQASYLCYQLSIDNGATWLTDTKYFDAGITFKSNNYANNAYTDNSSVGILTNDGAGFLIQPYDGNSCFGEVNFNNLMNNSFSKKANINFTYNTDSANGVQGFYTACAGYYDKVSCNAIRFFLSSGNFKKGKIKYYVMN